MLIESHRDYPRFWIRVVQLVAISVGVISLLGIIWTIH
jgi:hypothetical protein